MVNIAILGWGSLIWEERPEFDLYLGMWTVSGPQLPIEFCRKSSTRHDALTLVIDDKLGTQVETLYALSKRSDPRDAICDLCNREGTTIENIGFVNIENGEERSRDQTSLETIKAWALLNNIHFVVWTDLASNFPEMNFDEFVTTAIRHLKSPETDIQEAVKYIMKAPPQTNTRLRKILMNDEWFSHQIDLYNQGT